MNDEFLHALRREPRPEFVDKLKRKLQAPVRRRPARRAFLRMLIAVFLIGGAAVAGTLWIVAGKPPKQAVSEVPQGPPAEQRELEESRKTRQLRQRQVQGVFVSSPRRLPISWQKSTSSSSSPIVTTRCRSSPGWSRLAPFALSARAALRRSRTS
jgi:hypothetical protein